METVSSRVAAIVAGISYRQLDYWARTGVVEPSVAAEGSGSSRGYSKADLIALRIVSSLEAQGLDLGVCRTVMGEIRDQLEAKVADATLVVTFLGAELVRGPSELGQRLAELATPAIVTPLWSLADTIEADVRAAELRLRRAETISHQGRYGLSPWNTSLPVETVSR